MVDSINLKTLGDYFYLQRGTTYKSSLLGQPGPVLLGLASISRNGGFRSDSLKTYGGDSPENLLLRPGDLYVSLKDVTQSGDLLGSVARVPEHCPVGRLTQDTVKLIPKTSNVPLAYLYWLMRTPQYRDYCRSHATGTTNLGLSREDFLAFPAPEPNRVQDAIVAMLESVESKIETCRRSNKMLESLIRAIFKAWFIDFEPVKAKAGGAASFRGMPQAIFDALPDQFISSPIGPVPMGWNHVPIGDLVVVLGGSTPSTKRSEYWQGGKYAFATPKDMSRLQSFSLMNTERHITELGLATISSGQLPAGTVLLSSRAPIGYLAIADVPVAVNQGIIAMVSDQVPNMYTLLWVEANMDAIEARASGSTFAEISKSNFRSILALQPSQDALASFGRIAEPFLDLIVTNEKQCAIMHRMSAALLGVLITGNLRAGSDT